MTRGPFVFVWIALCVLVVAPVFCARTLPILDLPNHLALVRGWLSYDDAAYRIAENYTLQVRAVPYLLFYAVCRGLAAWMDLELAAKLSLALYLLAFVHGALALALAARRSPALAFAAFPLAFGPPWTFGFANYLYGAALLLYGLAAAMMATRSAIGSRARIAWTVATGAFAIAVLASHVLAWGYLGLGLLGLSVHALRRDRAAWRRAILPLIAALPSLCLFLWSAYNERAERQYFRDSTRTSLYYRPFFDLVNDLPRWILETVPGDVDRLALLLILLTVLGCWLWRDGRATDDSDDSIGALRAIAFVWIGAYLILPESAYQPTRIMFISHRAPVLFALILALAAPRPRSPWLFLPVVVAAILIPATLIPRYRDFSRRQEPFFALVDKIPRGAPTLVVPRHLLGPSPGLLTPDDPTASVPVYWHFTSWPMALRGGVSPHLFDQGIPIRPRRALWAPFESKVQRVDLRAASGYEYFLLHEPTDPQVLPLQLVARDGSWALYRRAAASPEPSPAPLPPAEVAP